MTSAPSDEIIGGRYRLGPVIGRGGMAEVRRAHDDRLGRDVAVKLLRADLAADPVARERFETEARAAAGISHPNAVTVYDNGEHEGRPYIVMECVRGGTLRDEMASGPLAPDRVRDIAIGMLGALGAAHAMGIIHRDVKPANILVTTDGTPKLSDFGIAKTTDGLDHTVTGELMGTPAYVAPERLAGSAASPQSDLYSLGIVLYEALTGAKPFHGDTPLAIVHAIHTAHPVPVRSRLPEIDSALAGSIDRAMDKNPLRRYATAEDMASALAAPVGYLAAGFAEDDATQAVALAPTQAFVALPPPPVDVSSTSSTSSKHGPSRAVLAVAIAALVVVLGAGAMLALGSSDDEDPGQTGTTGTEPGLSSDASVTTVPSSAPQTTVSPSTVSPSTAPTTAAPPPTDKPPKPDKPNGNDPGGGNDRGDDDD